MELQNYHKTQSVSPSEWRIIDILFLIVKYLIDYQVIVNVEYVSLTYFHERWTESAWLSFFCSYKNIFYQFKQVIRQKNRIAFKQRM